jgi:ornithine cyclodeaminase/alanine dehydrogenase-like protein (mu-crystallin family)
MSDDQLTIIDSKTTRALMDFPGLIESAERAFVAQAQGKASAPAYINMPIGENFAHYKAGYIAGSAYFAVKYSGGFWGNEKLQLPVDYGYVVVHSAKTGKPEVMFWDGGAITDYRTAAAGAVASKYASRENSTIVGVIGTGIQARLQVEALMYVRPKLTTVKIWGRNAEHVAAYISEMSKKFPKLKYVACDKPENAVTGVDIVITVTPSREPIVKANWIDKGTHITAIGACAPYMQEHEPQVLAVADKIYVDSIEKCSHDGELHHALDEKVISPEKITGELGNLISHTIPGRQSNEEITFVDLVGLGIQDATAAEYLLKKHRSS